MSDTNDWRDAVRVTRGTDLQAALAESGRATALEFAGTGGVRTWIGRVSMAPGARNGGHAHGRHEAALFVLSGRGRARWGERLEFFADFAASDFVYFAPHVPHEEINLDTEQTLEFVVIRSDGEKIFTPLDL